MPEIVVTEDIELKQTPGGRGPGGGDRDDGGDRGGPRGRQDVPRSAYLTGIALGIGAILMFFMALVSAYIVRKGIGGDWRPTALPNILWASTLVLVLSSLTIERARKSLAAARVLDFRRWWAVTTVLGLLFLAGQFAAWRQLVAAGVYVSTNPSSSFFYVLTAAHGLHLLGGLVALLYIALRTAEVARRLDGIAVEVTSIYWHFMDGLWVFLFLLLQLGR